MNDGSYAGDISPKEAWDILEKDPKAVLVDVRTHAEWAYVGLPDVSTIGKDLHMISWILFPKGEVNTEFTDDLEDQVPDKDATVLFLCRSGVRSIAAAEAAPSSVAMEVAKDAAATCASAPNHTHPAQLNLLGPPASCVHLPNALAVPRTSNCARRTPRWPSRLRSSPRS